LGAARRSHLISNRRGGLASRGTVVARRSSLLRFVPSSRYRFATQEYAQHQGSPSTPARFRFQASSSYMRGCGVPIVAFIAPSDAGADLPRLRRRRLDQVVLRMQSRVRRSVCVGSAGSARSAKLAGHPRPMSVARGQVSMR
jgi:hypothetical protein